MLQFNKILPNKIYKLKCINIKRKVHRENANQIKRFRVLGLLPFKQYFKYTITKPVHKKLRNTKKFYKNKNYRKHNKKTFS